jgi:hypothetical protein
MNCISCGMPLRTNEDHAASDPAKDYCRHCARADGSLKSYDEALAGMAGFLQKTQGLDEGVALSSAKAMMAKMPAWKGASS